MNESVVVGRTTLAKKLARTTGNNLLFGIFLATLMVPFQLIVIPQYLIRGQLRWIDTHLALIVPAASMNALGVFLLRQYLRGIPLELEEAAAIDGAGRIKIFVTTILPLLRTPIVVLGIVISLAGGTTSSHHLSTPTAITYSRCNCAP